MNDGQGRHGLGEDEGQRSDPQGQDARRLRHPVQGRHQRPARQIREIRVSTRCSRPLAFSFVSISFLCPHRGCDQEGGIIEWRLYRCLPIARIEHPAGDPALQARVAGGGGPGPERHPLSSPKRGRRARRGQRHRRQRVRRHPRSRRRRLEDQKCGGRTAGLRVPRLQGGARSAQSAAVPSRSEPPDCRAARAHCDQAPGAAAVLLRDTRLPAVLGPAARRQEGKGAGFEPVAQIPGGGGRNEGTTEDHGGLRHGLG